MGEGHRFALNPAGRLQTRKLRPTAPVVDLLHSWLEATDEWFVCRETTELDPRQKIEMTVRYGVDGIRSAWISAPAPWHPGRMGAQTAAALMVTILANRRMDLVELEMALGHRALGQD